MKQYNIKFTKTFKDMLSGALRNCEKISKLYALKVEKEVYAEIDLLEAFPHIAMISKLDKKVYRYRKFVIKGRFSIVYKIKGDIVILCYFIDGRKSPKNYLQVNENNANKLYKVKQSI